MEITKQTILSKEEREKLYFEFCGNLFKYPNNHEILNCSKCSDWGIKVEYEALESHPDIMERGRKMGQPIDHKKYGYATQDDAIAHFYKLRNKNLKQNNMSNLLYVIAVILVVVWAIGFLGFNAGGIIHCLLVIALIAVLLRVIQGGGRNG